MRRRRIARICALQALYSLEINPIQPAAAVAAVFNEFQFETEDAEDADPAVRAFCERLVKGAYERQDEIDSTIQKASTNWKLARMAIVDRNVLRLGVFELLFCEDIPKRVTINEAIELGKTFGSEDSSAFINGVLDNISKKIKKE